MTDLKELLSRYAAARVLYDEAKANRDTQLDALLDAVRRELPDEGTTRFEGDGYAFKVVTGFNYSVDRKVALDIDDELSNAERAAIIWKPSLDKRAYDKLDPETILNAAVSAKPKKPVIKDVEIVDIPF